MGRNATTVLGVASGALVVAAAWALYQRATTERVPYTVVARIGDVELRRYPPAALAETVAPTEREAFGRLFRYISGANEPARELSMTAPVETNAGATLPMTAPVETAAAAEGAVRMAFYLPAADADSAPQPTDDDVTLVALPARTLAVRRFSWRPTDRRVGRERERLLATLDRADVRTVGDPFFLGYDAPWTPPFLRRNEVAVAVEDGERTRRRR